MSYAVDTPSLNPSVATIVPAVLSPPSREEDQLCVPKSHLTTRVLHVVNGEHFAGAERVQQHLGRLLPLEGVSPTFLCCKSGEFPSRSQLPAELIETAPMRHRFDFRPVVSAIVGLQARCGIDLLHAHTPRAAVATLIASRRLQLPWVYHVHSPAARDSTAGWNNRINAWIEKVAVRRAAAIIVVSASLAEEMQRRGVTPDRITVVPNGVAEQPPRPARHTADWTLGMVALFRPRKGVEVLIDAFDRIAADHPSAQLRLIGRFESDEYEAAVRRRIERTAFAKRIHCTGFIADIPAAVSQLDALVLPSLFGEGMPMVVLESLASGVPVIASRVEGTPEVVRDGVEGFLCEPNDARSLANSLQRLLTLSDDQWRQMSTDAWSRHRSCFTDRRMASSTAALYRSLQAATSLASVPNRSLP